MSVDLAARVQYKYECELKYRHRYIKIDIREAELATRVALKENALSLDGIQEQVQVCAQE